MAGRVRSYADLVAAALGGAGDPRVADLLAAADELDAALGAPADLSDALDHWRRATDALHDRLVDFLMSDIPIGALPVTPNVSWRSPDGISLDASLGPLAVHVNGPALSVPDPNPGGATIVVGPQPPNAVQAHLDAGPISGDGALQILPDGVNGALALHLGVVEVAALASLRRIGGEGSFLAVMAAGFTPGIQFGFGFQLSRIGGLVGINRGFDTDALATRLRDGSAGEALFPLDAGDGARRALAALEAILPPRLGSSVAGPTLRLSWLEIAGQGFCSLDLGVFVELPGPQRIVIVGIARAGIPPILKLRIDVVGIIDFQRRLLSIDASLVDSGLLGIFTICGDVAFRQSWGDPAYTVVSVGGFYPGFRPEPAQIPPMRRLGFHLDLPVPGIDLNADGYFAVTSNTVQLGGHFEAGISAAGCGAHGFLDVDAIVQFTPFHVHAEVERGLRGRGVRADVRRDPARRHARRSGSGGDPRSVDRRDVPQGLPLRRDVHVRLRWRHAAGAAAARRPGAARPRGPAGHAPGGRRHRPRRGARPAARAAGSGARAPARRRRLAAAPRAADHPDRPARRCPARVDAAGDGVGARADVRRRRPVRARARSSR